MAFKRMQSSCIPVGLVLALVVSQQPANAGVISFSTAPGTLVQGLPVDASATFATAPGVITVLLANYLQDPTSIAQCLSGLTFSVSTGQTDGALRSALGVPRQIASGGTYTDGPAGGLDWSLSCDGNSFALSALGDGAPQHTIIGPPGEGGIYHSANSSIVRNRPHNPFAAGGASFILDVPGVTDDSSIFDVVFGFNTSGLEEAPSILAEAIPEPSLLMLLGLGSGMLLRRRRR